MSYEKRSGVGKLQETVVTRFKAPYQYSSEVTEESHEKHLS